VASRCEDALLMFDRSTLTMQETNVTLVEVVSPTYSAFLTPASSLPLADTRLRVEGMPPCRQLKHVAYAG
jgi:hypothetical protein